MVSSNSRDRDDRICQIERGREREKIGKACRAVFNFDGDYMAGTFRARSIAARIAQIDAEHCSICKRICVADAGRYSNGIHIVGSPRTYRREFDRSRPARGAYIGRNKKRTNIRTHRDANYIAPG